MDTLLELLFGQPWQLTVAVAVYGIALALFKDVPKSEVAWKGLNGHLIQNTIGRRYKAILRSALDRIDQALTPQIGREGWRPEEVRSAWSYGLLNWCLALAVIYPVLSVMTLWVALGIDGRLGPAILMPASAGLADRALPGVFLALAIVAYVLAALWRSGERNTALRGALLVLATACIWAMCFALDESVASTVLPAALSMIFLIAIALSSALKAEIFGVLAIAISIALVTVAAVMPVLADVVATSSAFSVLAASYSPEQTVYLLIGLISVGLLFLQRWLGKLMMRPATVLCGYVGLLILLTSASVLFGNPAFVGEPFGAPSVLLVEFLPLLNAVADFASSGLTRYCLRGGIEGRIRLAWVWDVVGAVAAFVLVVVAIIAIALWVRWPPSPDLPNGLPLIDLFATLADIQSNPGDYWWLYITFLSTLVPTYLHGVVALFSVCLQWFTPLRAFIVSGLAAGGAGHDWRGRLAVWALCGAITASVMVPLSLFVFAVEHSGPVGYALLDLFEWIAIQMATATGVPVPPNA